ncbi:MAG: hypothetical protein ABI183_04195 [Polyangiaceae bacterium]
MSDSPPKDATGLGPEEAAAAPVPVTDNSPINTEVPAAGALADAAKAMDAVVAKSDVPLPAEPAVAKDSVTTQPAAPEVAKVEPPKPMVDVFQLPATTSGMHQQYVAPGVARQSMISSMKYQIALAGIVVTVTLFMLLPSGGLLGLGNDPPTTTVSTSTSRINDDTANAFPNPNINQPPVPIPHPDLTVNAGAIGGSALPLVKKGDAGVNKGGYAEESADLDAAEAMVSKDPVKALLMVDQHDVDYPRGILDPEARVIRVEAYAKKGDDVKALQLGDEFLEDYPHSPRAGRVVAIVEALRNKLDSGH